MGETQWIHPFLSSESHSPSGLFQEPRNFKPDPAPTSSQTCSCHLSYFMVLRGAGVPTTAQTGPGRDGAFYICRDKQGQDCAISEPVSTKGEKGENYKNCPRFPRPPPKNGFRPAGTRFILRRLRVLSGSPQNEDREEINTPIRIDCSRASP